MDTKKASSFFPQKIPIFVLAALFFLFPLAISPITTEFFAIPKQATLAIGSLFALLFLSITMIIDRKVRIRRTPFDLSLAFFTFVVLMSAIFAVNKTDSFIYFTILLFAVIIYFTTVNSAKDKGSILFLATSLILGGAVSSLISILSFFKIYVLPYTSSRIETFTPIGSLLDQAIYLSPLLSIALYIIWQLPNFTYSKIQENLKLSILFTASIIILIGLTITIYQLIYKQRPTILPFETGFQTAFAAISQDTGRTIEGFLFGSGFGTYSVDFSRFKQVSFNQNKDLWSLTFFRSSSFLLEILATIGIVGFLSFIFICTKVIGVAKNSQKNPFLISVFLIFATAFVLPFSFITQTLLLILLALFAAYEGALGKKESKFFDIDIQIVAFRKGLLALESPMAKQSRLRNRLLPILLNTPIFVFVFAIGYYSLQYLLSDLSFQRSIDFASQNNATLTYEEQVKAIKIFPYRDGYYRVHSQTNLALANSLASQIKPGETPPQQTQQNIISLIQQSINSARTATAIAPFTAANWQNLSNTYRSLLGYGQNADQFAIASQQQTILLNPNSPLPYLTLGGIHYQLGRWDEAQNQFQIATKLKSDLPNAYYNLGHALEEKGDIEAALEQYKIAKRLLANNPAALKQITDEINALNNKEKKEVPGPLQIDQPPSSLPAREPQVEIPPPATPPATIRSDEEK